MELHANALHAQNITNHMLLTLSWTQIMANLDNCHRALGAEDAIPFAEVLFSLGGLFFHAFVHMCVCVCLQSRARVVLVIKASAR